MEVLVGDHVHTVLLTAGKHKLNKGSEIIRTSMQEKSSVVAEHVDLRGGNRVELRLILVDEALSSLDFFITLHTLSRIRKRLSV